MWRAALLLMLSSSALAEPRPLPQVLDDYVAEAMHSNLALQGESLAVDEARAALQAARARYLPELSLAARYTVNQGGRDIEIPVGDLLNPVYSTLNSMLAAQGQSPRFPQIENQSIPFLRDHEQDTHLSLRQALYAPGIAAGKRAQQAAVGASEQQRMGVARQLKRDVITAYLNWLQAQAALDIIDATRAVLTENHRINQSLFDNGKVTEDQPLRAQAELLNIEQQLQQARDQATQAQSYLNFLLNRPLDTALEPAQVDDIPSLPALDLGSLRQAAEQRPELKQLQQGIAAANENVRVARAAAQPSLALGVDVGIQGENYGFGPEYNYSSASLLFNWKFYAGGGLKAAVNAAKAQARRLQAQHDSAAQQIALQVQQSADRYRTVAQSLATARARVVAAQATARIASRKRDEGAINQVEFLDAHNALTSAQLNLNVTRYAMLIAAAQLQYVTAQGEVPLP